MADERRSGGGGRGRGDKKSAEKGGPRRGMFRRRKVCKFCTEKVDYIDYKDAEGLAREAREGARMGYAGKQVIHPSQIAPTQEAFTPDEAAIAQALRVMNAMREHQAAGKGAFSLDGKMIDMPLVKAAERVLARARAAGRVE